MRRKVGAIVITSIILILTLAYFSQPLSHQTRIEGIPVLNSVFAELVETEPDPVVFPQFPVLERPASITMKFDYTGFEKVNESMALAASIDFISQIWYLSDLNLSTDSIILEEELWRLRFIDESIDVGAYVSLNAMSGKVCDFEYFCPGYASPFQTNTSENQFANTSELEQLALDFFNQFNYSLSPHARYIGPKLVHNYVLHHDVFVISFTNVVNETLVDGKVLLYLDVEANAVLCFSYSWVHVDTIPKENIISPEQVKQIVRHHFNETFSVSPFVIESVTLVFDRYTTVSVEYYRLGWFVSIDNEFVASAKVDAMSGIIYDEGFRI